MVTIEDLTEDEQIDFWQQIERHAQISRRHLVRMRELRMGLESGGVSQLARDEVLTKETQRLQTLRGTQPVPDDIRMGEKLL